MNTQKMEEKLESEFHVSKAIIVYKFVLGFIELILGFGVVFGGRQVFDLYQQFVAGDLFENPHYLLAGMLEKIIPYVFEHQGYIVFILLALGFVKVFGAIGLVYKKHWGLDLLVVLTLMLLPIDGYELFVHPTWAKFIYFAINIFISLFLVNFKPKDYFTDFKKRTTFKI